MKCVLFKPEKRFASLASLPLYGLILLCMMCCTAGHAQRWDFESGLDGWEGFGTVASAEAVDGAMQITYPASQLSGAPGAVRSGISFNSADYRYLALDIEIRNAPTTAPVTCLVWWMQTAGGTNGGVGARTFQVKPIAGRQPVLLDMLASGDLFDAWAGQIIQLRIETPWEYDASNMGDAWKDAVTCVDRIELSTTPGIPEYPADSEWGALDAAYDPMQWPGGRFNDRRSLYEIDESRNVLSGFGNMYHPKVLQTNDPNYPYKMWFFGWAAADCNPGYSGCDAIFHARSADMDNWEVYSGSNTWDSTMDPSKWVPVIAADEKPYDEWHNGDPSVVYHDGLYYMAYSATGRNNDGYIYCVMGATSADGIYWQRTSAPLLVYGPEISGGASESDATRWGMFHRPSLMLENGYWRLWFDYWLAADGGVSMGYAETPEAQFTEGKFQVLFAGDNPLLKQWPNPSVVKAGCKYYSFSDATGYGSGWPSRQIVEAESDDGLNWTITGYIPPDSDSPADQVPEATVITENGYTWLVVFYACQIGGDPYDWRYNRIRYMKRMVDDCSADGRSFRPGDVASLCVPGPVAADSTYTWTKDGEELAAERFVGADSRTLQINPVGLSDAGTYRCEYLDENNEPALFELTIYVAYAAPLAALPGLAVMLCVLMYAGATRIKN